MWPLLREEHLTNTSAQQQPHSQSERSVIAGEQWLRLLSNDKQNTQQFLKPQSYWLFLISPVTFGGIWALQRARVSV